MDDKPTNEEPKKDFNKLDLSQLEDFSFGTQWTQDKPEKGGGSRARDDRPRRDSGRDNRKDRRGFKRPAGAGAPGEDGPGGGGGRPGGGDRGRDRRGGGPGGPGGSGKRGPRGGRGEPRPEGGRGGPQGRPPPPYQSPYFDVTFYPEDVSFAALAKTIRASCRTFELFDIAKTVIGKEDRFVVVLQRKPGKDPENAKQPFYVSVPDGLPFESEEAALNHVMQNHVDTFFTTEQVETEPPKGNFQVINRCGVTGELLGPPNYHLYNHILQQHHATRLPRMAFETFKNRIESVREQEVVDAWLEMMKKVTRYTWIGDGGAASPAEKSGAPSAAADAPAEESSAEATPDEASASAGNAAESETNPDEAAPAADSSETAAEETTSASADEAPAAATPAAGPSFDSLTEARVYLRTHARDKAVRTYEHGRFHGRNLPQLPDGEIKRAIYGTLERQRHFPLDTANALRGRLRREGFTIFKKGSKGISYVCAVKRKFRVPGQTFADSINDLITFIEAHPMVKVSELPEKFLAIKPAEAPKAKEEEASTADAPPPPESAPPVSKPAGTVSPFAEADQPRIKRMHLDLRWLVTEGYVTEFIDGSLFAAPPMPEPKPKPKSEGQAKEKAEPKSEAKSESTDSPAEAPSETEAAPQAAAPAPETTPTPAPETKSDPDPASTAAPAEPPAAQEPTDESSAPPADEKPDTDDGESPDDKPKSSD